MNKFILAAILLGAAISQSSAEAGVLPLTDTTCGPTISCIPELGATSHKSVAMIPNTPVSAGLAAVPENCFGNALGKLGSNEIIPCEQFLAANTGSKRQRATALLNLGYAYLWSGRSKTNRNKRAEEAIKSWDAAIALEQNFVNAYLAKAEQLAMNDDAQAALRILEQAKAIDDQDWRVHAVYARVYEKLRQQKNYVESALRAGALGADIPTARHIRGNALLREKKFAEAISDFEAAAKDFKPNDRRWPGIWQIGDPYLDLAHAYHMAGNDVLAVETLNRYEKLLHPGAFNRFIVYQDRATYLEALGQFKEAAEDLQRAILASGSGKPDPSDLRARRATLLIRAGAGQQLQEELVSQLRSGDLNTILRVQVYLRNRGFDEVTINGKYSDDLLKVIKDCQSRKDCVAGLGQPI